MLSPLATASTLVWPIPGDVPDIQAIIWEQMGTITDQAALIDAYQQVLNQAQAVTPPPQAPPASATATLLQDQMSVTGVSGTIAIGATVTPTVAQSGWPAGGVHVLQQLNASTFRTDASFANSITGIGVVITPAPTASPNPSWPTATDAPTLQQIAQAQVSIIRNQNALIQQYQDLLNTSETPPPATGP